MRGTLILASLRQHRMRTALAIIGVAVAGALLLDMVMLATGMRASFRSLLLVRGYQLRVTPRGTLPFDTDATITQADAIGRALSSLPGVTAVSPVLGGQLHVLPHAGVSTAFTSFALGIDPRVAGDYSLETGSDPAPPDHIIVNAEFEKARHVHIGDTIDVAAGFDPAVHAYMGRRRLVIAGRGRFYYTPADQPVAALPLAVLQAMGGPDRSDRVSLFMVRVADSIDPDSTAVAIERAIPRVSALSTRSALEQVDQRMGYFRQLALVLGAISCIVGYLLTTTLVTVSVQERTADIAVLRAIGVTRAHVVQQIVAESFALTLAGAIAGIALGLVTAIYFNRILADFPNLPAGFRFFVFRLNAAWLTLGLLLGSGVLAGLYPSWRVASGSIAATLRREAIA